MSTKWEPCPRCKSNRVKQKLSFDEIIAIIAFLISIGIFGIVIGFIIGFIAIILVLSILSPFVKNKKRKLNCKDCDYDWEYSL